MRNVNKRRGIERVILLQPLRGKIGDTRIFIVNASLRGFCVAHQDRIGDTGDLVHVVFEYDGFTIRAQGEIRWTLVHQSATAGGKAVHRSGMKITEISKECSRTLIDLVEMHVIRALDEQKANAKGLPAIAAQSFQTGAAKQFIRHEYRAGSWRESKTTESKQPRGGFTLAADTTLDELTMLRTAYEAGDEPSRTMIRDLAAVSISVPDGIPARKYEP